MATKTPNLGLTAPQMADQVGSTIPALAANMGAIDTEFGLSGTTANRPTTGLYVGRRYFDTTLGQVIWWNGSAWVGPTGLQNIAVVSVSDMQLTSTSATTVASLTPSVQGNYSVRVYYRVVTAPTNVTITVTYTDGSGAETVYALTQSGQQLNALSQNPGSYVTQSMFFNATNTSAITVSATAGTANQVYVSATIKPE
jgi:hypothetical protein